MQTIAQTWLDEGKKIGHKAGHKAGHKEGHKVGHKAGHKAGREVGERKTMIKALNQTLTIRFDVVLGEFDKQFAKLDIKSLEQLNKVALKVNSVADFEKALTAMPRKKQAKTTKKKTG